MVYKFIEDLDLLDGELVVRVRFFEHARDELGADSYEFPGDSDDELFPVSKEEAAARLEPLVRGMFAFAEKHYCEKTSMKFRMTRDFYGIGTPKLSVKKIAKKYNLAEWVVDGIISERVKAMRHGIFGSWGYLFVAAMYLPGEEYEHFLDAMRANRAVIKKECRNAIPILECISAK